MGKKGYPNLSQHSKLLDIEVETRTGVICQLQRSLMEVRSRGRGEATSVLEIRRTNRVLTPLLPQLERESKTNILQSAGGNPLPSGPERFIGLSKIEGRFMLHSVFDSLIETKHQVEKLTATAHKRDEDAIEAAVEQQRGKAREQIKELKFEHSEAMMTLMEATKGAVEHKVGMEIMEAAGNSGGIDANLKNTVDEMLGSFLDGFSKVGDELFIEFENMKEEDRKEKERAEAKVSERRGLTRGAMTQYQRPTIPWTLARC